MPAGGPAAAEAFRRLVPEGLEPALGEVLDLAMRMGVAGADAWVDVSLRHRTRVRNGRLLDASRSLEGGVGLRILRQGPGGLRAGLASTTDLARRDFRGILQQAWELAALADPDPWLRQGEGGGRPDPLPHWWPESAALGAPERLARARQLEAAARAASPRVDAVREAVWEDGAQATLLLDARGRRTADLGGSCGASIELAVADGEERQAAWNWGAARRIADLDPAALGREAALKGEAKLHARPLPSGRHRVLLHPEVVAELLELVAEMLSGEAVLRGRSLFTGRTGQAVAAPCLSLVDEGRLPGGLGSASWDGEGLPTGRTPLIEGGRLVGHLHTLATAAEMGALSGGNARRSHASHPAPGISNLQPLPGPHSLAELLGMAGGGILVTELMGLHTVDPVSGHLSVGLTGRRIRCGAAEEAVDRMTLAGNLEDLLQRVVALGGELRWYGERAGVPMLLDGVMLGGA